MSDSSTAVVDSRAEKLERYIELHALDLLLTSNFALGEIINEQLGTVDVEDGNLFEGAELMRLYGELDPDEPSSDDLAGVLANVRADLLLARLLRAIAKNTKLIEQRARYFEGLAARELEKLAAGEFPIGTRISGGHDA